MILIEYIALFAGLLSAIIAIYQAILAFRKKIKNKKLKELNELEELIEDSKNENLKKRLLPKDKLDDSNEKGNELTKKLTLKNIINSFNEHNSKMLLFRYKEKYNSNFFLSRESISKHFVNFNKSKKNLMVLTGNAGTGKSVFICNLVKNCPENTNIWIQDCASLKITENDNINSYIGNSLGFSCTITKIFSYLKKKKNSNMLVLIFDAINEHKNNKELLSKISHFVNEIDSPNIKVILTCRNPLWSSLRRFLTVPYGKEFHASGPNSYVNFETFNESECEGAYNLYKDFYKLKTEYRDLSNQVQHFITQPLFLKLTAESFEEDKIPKVLFLNDVFSKYIIKCLGKEGLESIEYKILNRSIKLMYENAVRELKLSILKNDKEVGHYINFNSKEDPYLHLLHEGLLSKKETNQGLLQKIELIFVTYERVFEFLLADLILGNLNEIEIINHLEIAQIRMFSQLRGAVELALSFSIINEKTNTAIITKLAKLNRPDSRQFLCDVIQTIYETGNKELVDNIINKLSCEDGNITKLLAVQVSYQLRLDNKLVGLSLTKDQYLRDIASLYIYERWNKARLDGNLEDGYQIIKNLVSKIDIKRPKTSYNAFLAFFSISINMGIHIVDDPKSLKKLIAIFKELMEKVPGLVPDINKGKITNKISAKASQAIIAAITIYFKKVMADSNVYKNIFTEDDTKRALLDVGSLINIDDLTEIKEKIVSLITWDNPAVNFSSRSVLTCQVYLQPEIHFDFLLEMHKNYKYSILVRANILHAIIYGLISRLLNKKSIHHDNLDSLFENVFDLIQEYIDLDSQENIANKITKEEKELCYASLEFLVFGITYLDSFLLRHKGISSSASYVNSYKYATILKDEVTINLIIWALENIGYQGFPEYSIITLSDSKFKNIWQKSCSAQGLSALCNLRSLFQDKFDSILQYDEDHRVLWNQVKSSGSFPNPNELWKVSYGIWIMIGTAINTDIMKISGLMLLDLVNSENLDKFIRNIIKTLLSIVNDPDIIDIAHIQYGLAHDPDWNLFKKLEINKAVLHTKPEIHDHYKTISNQVVKNFGRGILYDHLKG